MDIEKRFDLIKQVGEEILTEQELKGLLQKKKRFTAYDGFEPSGKMHIGQGLVRTINVNKMVKAGGKFKMFVADWHAWLNNKMGGDLDKIHTVGKYLEEVWLACGMDIDNVEFINSTKLVSDQEYWKKVVKIARAATIPRMIRCSQIMGREEKEVQYAAQVFYPAMQAADIFHIGVDICQLGMDQRKVNVLARELAPKLGWQKPVAVHHHMLLGLQVTDTGATGKERAIQLKMSKSNPNSAVFMTDSEKEVEKKITDAYCPAKQAKENPVLEYCKYIVFEKVPELIIKRPEKFGGELRIKSYEELEKVFATGKLHPLDLKKAVAKEINTLLEPVRRHFSNGKPAELLNKVQGFSVTR